MKMKLLANSHTKGAEGQPGDVLDVDAKTAKFFRDHGVAVAVDGDDESDDAGDGGQAEDAGGGSGGDGDGKGSKPSKAEKPVKAPKEPK